MVDLPSRAMHPFLIFDLDGTLSDPAVGVLRSINHALDCFGYPTVPPDRISDYIGPPIDQTFAQLAGSAAPQHVAELVACYRERYSAEGYAQNVLYPGIPDALEVLRQRSVSMGVCTSKRVDFAERILNMFDLRRYFVFVSGGEDGRTKTHHLRELLASGHVPHNAIMIGDRAVDVHAGRDNGLGTVGVLWGHGSEVELREAGAGTLLTHPGELPDLP
jgi:phosphoglycolate phosphatase